MEHQRNSALEGWKERIERFEHHWAGDDFEAAKKLAFEMLEAAEQATPDSGLQIVEAYSLLGDCDVRLGDLEQAIHNFTVSLATLESHPQSKQADLLRARALSGLATSYLSQGSFEKAEGIFHECIRVLEQTPELPRSELADAYTFLGRCHALQEVWSKAQEALEHALEIYEEEQVDGSQRLIARFQLADLYYDLGKLEAAGKLLDDAKESIGEDHGVSTQMLGQLGILRGRVLMDTGKLPEAESEFSNAISLYAKAYGDYSPQMAQPLCNMGHLCLQAGDFQDAEKFYLSALDVLEQGGEASELELADVRRYVGRLYFDVFRAFEEARNCFEQIYPVYEKEYGVESGLFREAIWTCALCYSEEGEYAKAVPLMERSLESYEKERERDPALVMERLELVATNYRLQRRHDEEERCLKRAISLCENQFGRGDRLADLQSRLAVCYQQQSKYAIALQCFEDALVMREELLGAEHPLIEAYKQELDSHCAVYHLEPEPEGTEETEKSTEIFEVEHLKMPGIVVATPRAGRVSAREQIQAHMLCNVSFLLGEEKFRSALIFLDQMLKTPSNFYATGTVFERLSEAYRGLGMQDEAEWAAEQVPQDGAFSS